MTQKEEQGGDDEKRGRLPGVLIKVENHLRETEGGSAFPAQTRGLSMKYCGHRIRSVIPPITIQLLANRALRTRVKSDPLLLNVQELFLHRSYKGILVSLYMIN